MEKILKPVRYNTSLRIALELYLDLTFICLLNIPNVWFFDSNNIQMRFRNQSYDVASGIAVAVAILAFIFPAVVMTIVGNNYRRLQFKRFRDKFGALMEGLQIPHREYNSLRAHYYSAFLMQRVLFSWTILVLYSWPLAQCIVISITNILVTGFAIIFIR